MKLYDPCKKCGKDANSSFEDYCEKCFKEIFGVSPENLIKAGQGFI